MGKAIVVTRDYIDQLKEACDREGCAYVIIVSQPGTEHVLRVHNLEKWTPFPRNTVTEELHQIVDLIGADQ